MTRPTGGDRAKRDENLEYIAIVFGWPDGALDVCRKIEAEHPTWNAWWDRDGDHGAGYYAAPVVGDAGTLYAPNAYELAGLIRKVEAG
jgi:hypothetical protein